MRFTYFLHFYPCSVQKHVRLLSPMERVTWWHIQFVWCLQISTGLNWTIELDSFFCSLQCASYLSFSPDSPFDGVANHNGFHSHALSLCAPYLLIELYVWSNVSMQLLSSSVKTCHQHHSYNQHLVLTLCELRGRSWNHFSLF